MSRNELRELIKSWVKVFAAGAMACYMAGVRDQWMLLDAGVAALIPVVYTWIDPSDHRFGTKA